MSVNNTLEHEIIHACEHLAEIGEYISNHTVAVELPEGLTIHVDSDARTHVVIFDGSVVFDATEDYCGTVLVDTFDYGAWVDTIISEYEALTPPKTGRS